MPPRHVYWTIIADGQPTAFRAAEREELLPTLKQLQARHPDATMMWFARGRLWPTKEAAEFSLRQEQQRGGERRGKDWRPGGEHKDPRDQFKVPRDVKRARFAARTRRDRMEGENRPPDAPAPRGDRPQGDRPFRPRDRGPQGDRPFNSKHTRPASPKPSKRHWGEGGPQGDRPFRPREDRPHGDRPFRPQGDRPQGDRPFRPKGDRPFIPRENRPPGGDRPFRPKGDRPFKPKGPSGGFKPRGGPPKGRSGGGLGPPKPRGGGGNRGGGGRGPR